MSGAGDLFFFAIAIQNLVWGLASPLLAPWRIVTVPGEPLSGAAILYN